MIEFPLIFLKEGKNIAGLIRREKDVKFGEAAHCRANGWNLTSSSPSRDCNGLGLKVQQHPQLYP